jgi:RNA polymerase sigma factor (sigma-70 family)
MTRARLSPAAKAARRRLRENAANNGETYHRVHTVGMTVEEKIAHYSDAQDDGCVYWTSPAKGRPELRFGGRCHSVRTLLWERRNGKLPSDCIVYVTCEHPRCIAEAHLAMMTRGKFLHTGKAQKKAQIVKRMRYGKDRERYLIEALTHVKAVRGLLYRKFGPRLDREDVLQEALLRVYLAWARDRQNVDDVRAFFMQIAVNIAIDVMRGSNYSRVTYCDPQAPALLLHVAPEEADPAHVYERALSEYRSRKRLTAHLRKLSPRVRQALRLQWQRDLSQREIAARMQLSENTVEQHLVKARRLSAARKATGWRNAL